MINRNVTERILEHSVEMMALLLWENGAVKVESDEPFKLASGNFSPIYINCRQVISAPVFMHLFTAFTATILHRNDLYIDMVAGGETAGIPFAGFLAHSLALPMLYVRKKAKSYGIASKVEGGDPQGRNVLLVEDLITDGGSKLGFIEALRAAGGIVEYVLVLFDRKQGGDETLRKEGVQLLSVTDLTTVLRVGRGSDLLSKANLEAVEQYIDDPCQWHTQRGLPFNG